MSASSSNPGRLPDFLVAGAMRSGTTSLYRYLGEHPEIFMVPKELEFFTEHFDRGVEWYRSQFAGAGSARVFGEATADYLARRSAMARIAEVLPSGRVIASLRNPVDRAWSHYGLLSARGREVRTFAAAIDDEISVIESDGPDAGGIFYLYHSLYDVHLERAYRLFPEEQIHVSIFERMAADPAGTYRDLCVFLGVDPSFVPAHLGARVNAVVTCRSLRVRDLSRRLPSPAERLVARLNTRRTALPPVLDDAIRRRLEHFFAPRIARVEDLLGERIPEWQPDSPSASAP